MTVRISAAARRDLAGIRDYIVRENPQRAVTFVEEIIERFSALAIHPLMGRAIAGVGDRRRVLVLGDYLIYYVAQRQDVRIVRVLHAARISRLH